MRYLIMLALAACTQESVYVGVECQVASHPTVAKEVVVNCDAKQTKGKSEVEACWDFEVTCGNGAIVKAPRTCAKVKDGGTSRASIPQDKLIGLDKCGGEKPVAKMANLTIDGKRPD